MYFDFLPRAISEADAVNIAKLVPSNIPPNIPDGDRYRVQSIRKHTQSIRSGYQPLHKELYTMDPAFFFVPSFIQAITENTEESLRSIISEPAPGLYKFEMLQPHFCRMLRTEVWNFEKYLIENKLRVMKAVTFGKYHLNLDYMGFEPMLTEFMDDFIRPMSKVFFPEVGGSSLDSHHSFITQYGKERDSAGMPLHVDESNVTLNVCLGDRFSGGKMYFRGVRCDKHKNSGVEPEEEFDYLPAPGQAVLYRGHHRHGVVATISGMQVNLVILCKSSTFQELEKYKEDSSRWCIECSRE